MSAPVDWSKVAASRPPAGQTPNFENPETHFTYVGIGFAILGMIASTAIIVMRIYTRAIATRQWGVEDFAVVLAWVISTALQIILILLWATKILGVHLWDITVAQANRSVVLTIISASVLYIPMTALSKYSLLIAYRDLSPSRAFKYLIYAITGFIAAYSVALFFAMTFACSPVRRNWDFTVTEGRCLNRGAIWLTYGSLDTAINLLLLGTPIPVILRMALPFRQKVGLIVMVFVGLATFIVSVIRVSVMPGALSAKDITWTMSMPAFWICAEVNLAIICACLPVMRTFFRKVAPRVIGEEAHNDHEADKDSAWSGRTSRGAAASMISVAELASLHSKFQPKIFTSYEEWDKYWAKDAVKQKTQSQASAPRELVLCERTGRLVMSDKRSSMTSTRQKKLSIISTFSFTKQREEAIKLETITDRAHSGKGAVSIRSKKSFASPSSNYSGTTIHSVLYHKANTIAELQPPPLAARTAPANNIVPTTKAPRPIQTRTRSQTVDDYLNREEPDVARPRSQTVYDTSRNVSTETLHIGLGIYGFPSAETSPARPRVSCEGACLV